MSDLDMDFISRAMRVTSFNLQARDFETLTYKKEIQHLFSLNFFPKANVKFVNSITEASLRPAIQTLRSADATNFSHLYRYNLKLIGPGEVMLYYLINNAHLGGGSSAGVDLVVGGKGYEIKAVDYSPQGYVSNFKVGGTFSLSPIINAVQKLKVEAGLGAGSEVNLGELQTIEKKFPQQMKKIYDDYATITYENYFKNHDIIFLSNKNGSRYKLGDLIKIKRVKKSDIIFERITSGTIKPRVII